MLFRFGVENEHAEGVKEHNRMQESAWQRWAKSGVPVLAKSVVLPSQVPVPSLESPPVVNITAFSPGDYPGHTALITELLIPLLPALHIFLRQHLLEVYLPEQVTSRDFYQTWENLGLAKTALLSVETTESHCFVMMHRWAEETENTAGRLVIFADWQDNTQHTQGAVAWLIGPYGYQTVMPVLCTLHRPMQAALDNINSATQQFLHYQPLALLASDLWLNEGAQPYVAQMMVQRASSLQQMQIDATALPQVAQQYLPHWLGKTGEKSAWFAVTLMMQMAECRKETQVLLHEGHNELMFFSVSAGAFSDD